MSERIYNPPDPQRVTEGLRDTGYSFVTAVADLIDNAIAANAENVAITLAMDYRGNIELNVADDGEGMIRDSLIDAMRYGSPERPNPMSLGKYGLGLKTASTAFCRQLNVTTRPGDRDSALKAVLDLDDLGDWEISLETPAPEDLSALDNLVGDGTGTVITWRKVDRLIKAYKDPGGKHAQNALGRYERHLTNHVGMVYQRYLDASDSRARTVKITINGNEIEPWNPFIPDESELASTDTWDIDLGNGLSGKLSLRAYILPAKGHFSSDEAARRAQVSNQLQGIYIYREGRLIHGPDWLGIYNKEPHGSLLRVEFSFNHELDRAFHIDIKKSRIELDQALYDALVDFLKPLRREADLRYRKGVQKVVSSKAESAHNSSNENIRGKEADIDAATLEPDPDSDGVRVTNPEGTFTIRVTKSEPTDAKQVFVQPVDGIDDGLLWEPVYSQGHTGVRINTKHPYYHKVYVPNLTSGVTIQGMDSLLWALVVAEFNTMNERVQEHFIAVRSEVSKILRKLVVDMPDPPEDSGDDD